MSEQLKPCPFCGEEAHRMQPVSGGWLVGCYDDNCAGSTCRAFNEDWNRRAPSPDLAAENERLRDALRDGLQYVRDEMPEGNTCSCNECALCGALSLIAKMESALEPRP